ncbi:hypothetical protein KRZ98_05295 [Sphingobium sp. AS12]|uniref:hypothetical protein n=1 Tax=Sphingobium sp. AS12 TaxID=2849495 RepID=UPI001C3154E2|nr:hypothetical protein [Sphingobium sp. AS12]MBV2147701.1 hypothetical protein [Sphingobium sp. AS12]
MIDTDNYEISTTDWNGITLEIRWQPEWISYDDGTGFAHLEVESIPYGTPIPVSETGYKSHFVHSEAVNRLGGPLNYVEAWLAQAARSPKWQQADMARRQLALF